MTAAADPDPIVASMNRLRALTTVLISQPPFVRNSTYGVCQARLLCPDACAHELVASRLIANLVMLLSIERQEAPLVTLRAEIAAGHLGVEPGRAFR